MRVEDDDEGEPNDGDDDGDDDNDDDIMNDDSTGIFVAVGLCFNFVSYFLLMYFV